MRSKASTWRQMGMHVCMKVEPAFTFDNRLEASIGELDNDSSEEQQINQGPDVEGVSSWSEVGCLCRRSGAEDRVHVTGEEEAVGGSMMEH